MFLPNNLTDEEYELSLKLVVYRENVFILDIVKNQLRLHILIQILNKI